jgi:hypothetical protein
MNTLTDRQQATLARGLSAFDESTRRRRSRRRALRGTLAVLVVGGSGFMLHRLTTATPSGLPAYVEIIRDDQQLAAELELADACERVNRTDGRLVVVECMIPESREATPAARDASAVGG